MTTSVHPAAPHHLPSFITAPGETDVLMVGMGVFLLIAVLVLGNFFLWLHSLPERMAHKSKKLQFELVAVLCLLALFTHIHAFWVAALLLAFIDLPEFGKPLGRMADSLEKIAGEPSPEPTADAAHAGAAHDSHGAPARETVVRIVPANAAPDVAVARSGKELTDA